MSEPAIPPTDPPPRRVALASILVPLGLLMACFAAYAPALGGQFIWDDDYYVVNNKALRTFEGIQDIWLGVLNPWTYPAPQYYPMTFTSLWLDFRIWGLNPLGYHLTNVLLHVLGAWTLWVVLRKLSIPGAAAAAFIFALHPVNVESVAWITERKNVLSGLFYLLSLLVYLRFSGLDAEAPARREPVAGDDATEHRDYELALPEEPWKLYALSLLLFVLALLSKTVTATLPAAVLVITWWKRGRLDLRRDVAPLLPFFALAGAMSVLTGWMERNVVGAVGADWDFTVAQRLLIAGQAVWFYVGKLLVPVNLAFMYERWTIDAASGLAWLAVLGVFATLAVAAALTGRIGRAPLAVLLLFGGTLLPALGFINFFPMRYTLVANHYVYLPSIALIAGVCAAGAWALRGRREAGIVVAAVACVALGVLSFRHARIYQGPETVWRDTIARSPGSWMAHNNLAVLLIHQGRLDEAETLLERVLQLKKNHVEAPMNLGRIAQLRGNRSEAERLYRIAMDNVEIARRLDADAVGRPVPRRLHAEPTRRLAAMTLESGDVAAAEQLYRSALKLDEQSPIILTELGEVRRRQNQIEEALELQFRANELDPDSTQVRNNLGLALLSAGRLNEALLAWTTVLQQDPDNARAAYNIGLYFVASGKFKDASDMFEMALRLDPEFAEAKASLEAARRRAATQPATAPSPAPAGGSAGPPS